VVHVKLRLRLRGGNVCADKVGDWVHQFDIRGKASLMCLRRFASGPINLDGMWEEDYVSDLELIRIDSLLTSM